MAARRAFQAFRSRNGLKYTFCAGSSLYLTHQLVGGFVWCNGPSMVPTVKHNDVLLTISSHFGVVSKGDVVIALNPQTYDYICKRVVGLAGEFVMFEKKILKIPVNHYWLEGDNKADSTDSRKYGPVPAYLIKRRCLCKVWPTIDVNFQDYVPVYCEAGKCYMKTTPKKALDA